MKNSEMIGAMRHFWNCNDDEGEWIIETEDRGLDTVSRTNWDGHITASALIFNVKERICLMIKSKKFGRFLLPGGHLECAEAPLAAAVREAVEETGISRQNLLPYRFLRNFVIPIEVNSHLISENSARSEPSHMHHDLIFLFSIDGELDGLHLDEREASELAWLPIEVLKVDYVRSHDRLQRKLIQSS